MPSMMCGNSPLVIPRKNGLDVRLMTKNAKCFLSVKCGCESQCAVFLLGLCDVNLRAQSGIELSEALLSCS